MLYLIFMNVTEAEASKMTGKKFMENSGAWFNWYSRNYNLNEDDFFIRALREIDNCDVPMPNVARDILTGDTYSFDKISGGVKSLWLIYHKSEEFVYPASFFGENCYKLLLEISKDRDIIIYDDVEMLREEVLEGQEIVFTDYVKNTLVKTSFPDCDNYYMNEVYI